MNLIDTIAVARDEYREYKRNGGRMIVPDNHISNPGYIRMSALDGCSVKHAYEKNKVEPDFEMTDSTKHLLEGGEYAAYMIQEALMYYAQTHTNFSFQPEYNIVDKENKLAGRADGLIKYMQDLPFGGEFEESVLLEIKYSEGMIKRSLPTPKLSYVLQCIAYMMGTGIPKTLLIIASKWSYDSAYYITTQSYNDLSSGFVVKHAKTGEEYDMGINLTTDEVVSRAQDFLNQIKKQNDDQFLQPLGIQSAKRWMCFSTIRKGTKPKQDGTITRTDELVPNCQFAKRCYGATGKSFHLEYDVEQETFSLPDDI